MQPMNSFLQPNHMFVSPRVLSLVAASERGVCASGMLLGVCMWLTDSLHAYSCC